MIKAPRIHRFWIKWPAPGMNQAIAGAMTDMRAATPPAAAFCASVGVVFVNLPFR